MNNDKTESSSEDISLSDDESSSLDDHKVVIAAKISIRDSLLSPRPTQKLSQKEQILKAELEKKNNTPEWLQRALRPKKELIEKLEIKRSSLIGQSTETTDNQPEWVKKVKEAQSRRDLHGLERFTNKPAPELPPEPLWVGQIRNSKLIKVIQTTHSPTKGSSLKNSIGRKSGAAAAKGLAPAPKGTILTGQPQKLKPKPKPKPKPKQGPPGQQGQRPRPVQQKQPKIPLQKKLSADSLSEKQPIDAVAEKSSDLPIKENAEQGILPILVAPILLSPKDSDASLEKPVPLPADGKIDEKAPVEELVALDKAAVSEHPVDNQVNTLPKQEQPSVVIEEPEKPDEKEIKEADDQEKEIKEVKAESQEIATPPSPVPVLEAIENHKMQQTTPKDELEVPAEPEENKEEPRKETPSDLVEPGTGEDLNQERAPEEPTESIKLPETLVIESKEEATTNIQVPCEETNQPSELSEEKGSIPVLERDQVEGPKDTVDEQASSLQEIPDSLEKAEVPAISAPLDQAEKLDSDNQVEEAKEVEKFEESNLITAVAPVKQPEHPEYVTLREEEKEIATPEEEEANDNHVRPGPAENQSPSQEEPAQLQLIEMPKMEEVRNDINEEISDIKVAREPEVREEQEENSLVVQEPEKEVNAQESEPLIPSNKLDVEVALHEKSKDEAESLFKLPEPEPEDIKQTQEENQIKEDSEGQIEVREVREQDPILVENQQHIKDDAVEVREKDEPVVNVEEERKEEVQLEEINSPEEEAPESGKEENQTVEDVGKEEDIHPEPDTKEENDEEHHEKVELETGKEFSAEVQVNEQAAREVLITEDKQEKEQVKEEEPTIQFKQEQESHQEKELELQNDEKSLRIEICEETKEDIKETESQEESKLSEPAKEERHIQVKEEPRLDYLKTRHPDDAEEEMGDVEEVSEESAEEEDKRSSRSVEEEEEDIYDDAEEEEEEEQIYIIEEITPEEKARSNETLTETEKQYLLEVLRQYEDYLAEEKQATNEMSVTLEYAVECFDEAQSKYLECGETFRDLREKRKNFDENPKLVDEINEKFSNYQPIFDDIKLKFDLTDRVNEIVESQQAKVKEKHSQKRQERKIKRRAEREEKKKAEQQMKHARRASRSVSVSESTPVLTSSVSHGDVSRSKRHSRRKRASHQTEDFEKRRLKSGHRHQSLVVVTSRENSLDPNSLKNSAYNNMVIDCISNVPDLSPPDLDALQLDNETFKDTGKPSSKLQFPFIDHNPVVLDATSPPDEEPTGPVRLIDQLAAKVQAQSATKPSDDKTKKRKSEKERRRTVEKRDSTSGEVDDSKARDTSGAIKRSEKRKSHKTKLTKEQIERSKLQNTGKSMSTNVVSRGDFANFDYSFTSPDAKLPDLDKLATSDVIPVKIAHLDQKKSKRREREKRKSKVTKAEPGTEAAVESKEESDKKKDKRKSRSVTKDKESKDSKESDKRKSRGISKDSKEQQGEAATDKKKDHRKSRSVAKQEVHEGESEISKRDKRKSRGVSKDSKDKQEEEQKDENNESDQGTDDSNDIKSNLKPPGISKRRTRRLQFTHEDWSSDPKLDDQQAQTFTAHRRSSSFSVDSTNPYSDL